MQGFQLCTRVCVFPATTVFAIAMGYGQDSCKESRLSRTTTGAHRFLVFSQIPPKINHSLVCFFHRGSLKQQSLSWWKEQEKEGVGRARTKCTECHIKRISGVPGPASTQVLFSASPRWFLKEISKVYPEHWKCSENLSLDASSAENTACYGSVKYY